MRSDALGIKWTLGVLALSLAADVVLAQGPELYFPGRWDDWERRTPEQVGMDAEKLDAAIQFAMDNFNREGGFNASNEPYDKTIGPVKDPSGMNGLVLRHGYIVAEWGDTSAVDMTFSVTKTYLSTTAGLAVDEGLIRDVQDPVRNYVTDGSFRHSHNRDITWHQLLNQTSGWEGTLWGKTDWSDRYRRERRAAEMPGESYRYNDTRVNQLALCLLQVWRRPLPQVLKERIMDPIGASPTWRWHGYENSWINVDGQMMQSVSGGGHWGGGMFINSRDHARFGYLFLRGGKWGDEQLISKKWIEMASTPTDIQPNYGYMNWFLNTDQAKQYRSAPAGNIFFVGAGTNLVWLDLNHDMVVVVRWIRNPNGFIGRVLEAFDSE